MGAAESPIVEGVASTREEQVRASIKRWLQATNLSQAKLGERIGKNQEWMSRYLAGGFVADLDLLEKIAGVFGHSLHALLHVPQDPQEARLLDIYRAMPARSRSGFLDWLANLVYPEPESGTRPPKTRG